MRTVFALLPLVGLTALTADPAVAGPSCDYDGLSFPAQVAQKHGTLDAAAGAAGVDVAKLDGAKSAWAFATDKTIDAIVKRPTGGYWHLPGLLPTGSVSCGAPDVSVIGHNPTVVRVMTDDARRTADGECLPEFFYWEHVIIEERSGKILAMHSEFMGRSVGPDGPKLELRGDALVVRGDGVVRAPMADLKRCATPLGLSKRKASMHWVNRGRKATKAGAFDQAISDFHNAQSIDGLNAKALSGYGYALLKRDKPGDADSALRAFGRAQALGEGDAYRAAVDYNIGLAHRAKAKRLPPKRALGSWQAAAESFQSSLDQRPNEAVAAKLKEANAMVELRGKPAYCRGVDKFYTPKRTASVSELLGMTATEACESSLCSDDRSVMVVEHEFEAHHVVVGLQSGEFSVLRGFFEGWSGAWCGWGPDLEAKLLSDRYAFVSQRGFAQERWEGACHDLGFVYEAAIVDRSTGEVVVGTSCDGAAREDTASLTLDGETVRYADCKGKTRTFSLKQAAACR